MERLFVLNVAWIAIGGAALLLRARLTASRVDTAHRERVAGICWFASIPLAAISIALPSRFGWTSFVISVALVNVALSIVVTSRATRMIAGLALAATSIAVALAILGAFSTVPLLAAACVLALGVYAIATPTRPSSGTTR